MYGFWWTAVFLIAIATAAYSVVRVGRLRSPGALMVMATAVEATLHVKLMPLFAIAWISHVPAYVQRTPAGQWIANFTQRRFAFVLSVWVLVTTMYLADAVRWKFWRMQVPQVATTYGYPVGSVEYLRDQHFSGNVMVPFAQGAYVSWKLYPAVKVSVDSRYEVAYSDELVDRIFRFYAAEPGWQETLNAYPTDLVLIPRIMPLATVIQQSGWNQIYLDGEFELYARPGLDMPYSNRVSQKFTGTFP